MLLFTLYILKSSKWPSHIHIFKLCIIYHHRYITVMVRMETVHCILCAGIQHRMASWPSLCSHSQWTLLTQTDCYRKISNISCTKSENWNFSCLVIQLSLCNISKLGLKLRMKMLLEQRQAILQLHLSDQQFYCLLRRVLYYRFDGICFRTLQWFCWSLDSEGEHLDICRIRSQNIKTNIYLKFHCISKLKQVLFGICSNLQI